MEATHKLIIIVAEAIGNIRTTNTGAPGYPNTLQSEMSVGMLEKIAKVAIEAIPTPPSGPPK